MTLSEELQWRGLVHQSTFKDLADLDKKKRTFYHGFDASADSQTIGNLAGMMLDLVFIRHGYRAVILAGGSTSLVGDPGGKDGERELQQTEVIEKNVEKAKEQIQKIFGDRKFALVNNLDWTKDVTLLDFLRDIGKNVPVGELVKKDFIATRLGEDSGGISFAEFSYTLLQGFDYLHLFDKHGVTLQLGGSDQWGNCITGVDLVRRMRGEQVHVLSLPLVINKSTGKKFGKSEDGAVWLDERKTSVYKFYQFWINVDDEGVEDYIKIYTELNKEEVTDIMEAHNEARSNRLAQKHLAYEVTKLVHGNDRAESIRNLSEVLYGGGDYENLSTTDFQELETELKTVKTSESKPLDELLVELELASSKGEARRFLSSNAIYINGQQLPLEKTDINKEDFIDGYSVIRRGKNTIGLAKL